MPLIHLLEGVSGRTLVSMHRSFEEVRSVEFRHALIYVAARQLFVPSLCIVLIGPLHHDNVADFYAMVDTPDDASHEYNTCYLHGCVICGDTPDAAGPGCHWTKDEQACFRCEPCTLCDRCRVCVDGEYHICIACLEGNESELLNSMQRTRLEALEMWWSIDDE